MAEQRAFRSQIKAMRRIRVPEHIKDFQEGDHVLVVLERLDEPEEN